MSSKMSLVHGDVYPSFVRMLQQGGAPSMSEQSVNVAGEVAKTKGDWIGLRLYVMCPDGDTAREMIPALIGVLARYGFEKSADGLLRMLSEAELCSRTDAETEDSGIWPKEAHKLARRGIVEGRRR